MRFNTLTKFWPEQAIYRSAIRAAVVIFISVYVSRIYSFAEEFWITISAMLVLQTAVGLTMRQGLQRFVLITLIVFLASYTVLAIKNNYIITAAAVIFLAIAFYYSLTAIRLRPQFTLLLMMAIVILIVFIIPPMRMYETHFRTLDVTVGGLIGLVGSMVIFPVHADTEFRKEVVPLLQSLGEYFQAIIDYLYGQRKIDNLINKKNQLTKAWQGFPDWVYETGFIPRFQAGHRHFLVRIEQIRQILFVLNYLVTYHYDQEVLQLLKQHFDDYAGHVQKLLHSITTVLSLQQLAEGADDLADSFNRLEITFKEVAPYSLETLDLNTGSLHLANFIHELRELGMQLSVLARALR